MFVSFDDASKMIVEGKLLHIAGTETLLRKLPKGNWVGGSTEYFMDEDVGGAVSGERLSVISYPYSEFSIKSYDENTISKVAVDAYDNGFSLVVIPRATPLHSVYAEKAPEFEQIYIKNIAGWVTGLNIDKPDQTPIAVNGLTGEFYTDKAAVMHIGVPDDKAVTIGIINLFEQDKETPVIEFPTGGFSADKCLIDGKETNFADYITQNNIDTKQPIVGDYSGGSVNVSFRAIEDGIVHFYTPAFRGIQYRFAKKVSNYAEEFKNRITGFGSADSEFACNCLLNFLHGELDGKDLKKFYGPITFGEIAHLMLSQTLIYVLVCDL
jgi:hypothetical protein